MTHAYIQTENMHTHMHMHESPSKIPAAYPRANFMIRIPELDGKTVKMFR